MIDIDKDSIVSELDITTCIKNLKNSAFWQNSAQRGPMDDLKASRVLIQINEGLTKKKMSHRALFDLCDLNKDNMVSCAEFVQGLKQVVTLA